MASPSSILNHLTRPINPFLLPLTALDSPISTSKLGKTGICSAELLANTACTWPLSNDNECRWTPSPSLKTPTSGTETKLFNLSVTVPKSIAPCATPDNLCSKACATQATPDQ